MCRKSRDTTSPSGKASAHGPAKAASHPPAVPRQASRHVARPATSRTSAPVARATGPVLLHENSGGITLLTLNRPQTRNSLSEAMLSALGEAFNAIAQDSKVRAVVIAANGPVFCAGHDLKELTARRADVDHGRVYFAQVMDACSAVMESIVRL